MTVSTVDVLRAARDLYAQAPSHAPKGDDPIDGEYCPLTAIAAVGAGDNLISQVRLVCDAENALYRVLGWVGVVTWNATHSTAEVLEAFDRAIEAQRIEEALKDRHERGTL